jgi:hypothetical protein
MPLQIGGMWTLRAFRDIQWLAFVGFEVLGYGRVSEVVPEGRGADEAEIGIERDLAAVEG